MPTEDDLYKPVVPGHPLYAQMTAIRLIANRLGEWEFRDPEDRASQIIGTLMSNDPPIFLCTAEELKEG